MACDAASVSPVGQPTLSVYPINGGGSDDSVKGVSARPLYCEAPALPFVMSILWGSALWLWKYLISHQTSSFFISLHQYGIIVPIVFSKL